MAAEKTFDRYETWKGFMNQWEKQANDMIHLSTNNREFIEFSKVGSDLQTRFLEMLQKNQELVANQLNLPTKVDLANVAKLTIQTEEKLDALEEQIWNLQDSIESSNKENHSMTEVSRDIIKQIKLLKTEQQRNKKELEKLGDLCFELLELKSELAELTSLKEEIIGLKALLAEKNGQQERELAVLSK